MLALCTGIPSSLKNLLTDEDQLVRERAARVLCNIARKYVPDCLQRIKHSMSIPRAFVRETGFSAT